MRCLAGLLVVVVGLCSTVSLLVGIRGALPVWPESFPEEVMYPFLDPIFEGDWMATLSKGRIHHVEVWNPYGLSEKFKVIFEDGKVASGKLMRPFSFWEPAFRPFGWRQFVLFRRSKPGLIFGES